MARDFPDSITDNIYTPDTAAIDITGSYLSLFCWFKADVVDGSDRALFSKQTYSSGGVQYSIGITSSYAFVQVGDNSNFDQLTWGLPRAGIWTPIVGVKSPTELVGMLGQTLNRGSSTRVIADTGANFGLGHRSDGGGGEFDGLLAHVAIWDAALVGDEMLALVRGANPRRIRPGNLRGYWPLTEYGVPQDYSRFNTRLTVQGIVTTQPFRAAPTTAEIIQFPFAYEQVAGAIFGAQLILPTGVPIRA